MERAFSVILWALSATRRSFQQSLQPPAVAVTSGNSLKLVSKCQTGTLFPSHWRSSPVTACYNYIIIATFEGLKQPLGLKQPQGLRQPLLVSGAAPVQCFENCFKQFQIVSNCYYIRSAASLSSNDCYFFDKQSW